jgi:putative ABC transport system permease protein
MKTRLAWLNLLHDYSRTMVAIAGVAFAVILILMQLGFYFSVVRTATRVYDPLQFDLLLTSNDYMFLARPGTFPRARLFQAASLPEVHNAAPFYVGLNIWANPTTGRRRGILVMGINPVDRVLLLPEVLANQHRIEQINTVLMDRLSRPEFGQIHPGLETEIGARRIRVAELFTLGTGFSADGAVLASDVTFSRLMPGRDLDDVSLGLVTLKPGSDPNAVAARLRALLPPDVVVWTRADIYHQEQMHWVTRTSVGIIFGLGVVVAVIVGVGVVYQVLASDIDNRLPEYATLKAMGYGPRYLSGVVLEQALTLALAGFLPGLLVSDALYALTAREAHVPMQMTLDIAGGVLLASMLMCVVSGLLSLRKVLAADPADLFA